MNVCSFVTRWVTLSYWSRRFDCYYCSYYYYWLRDAYVARWFVAIGAFRSSLLFLKDVVPSQDCIGIHATEISIPLSVDFITMKSYVDGLSLTLRVYMYKCGSQSTNWKVSVLLAWSETAEVWVRASRMSLSCSVTGQNAPKTKCPRQNAPFTAYRK